jgi:hypothetical protein
MQGTERMSFELVGECNMEIPVLVSPILGNGFQAEALGLRVEGATQDEALAKLRSEIAERTASGARIISLVVPQGRPPWAEFAGELRDDPMLDAWKEAMAEYRRQRDAELDQI